MRSALALLALAVLPTLAPVSLAGGWTEPEEGIVIFRLDVEAGTSGRPISVDLGEAYALSSLSFTCLGATGSFALVGPEGARIEGVCGPLGGWLATPGEFPAGVYLGAAAFQAARPIFFEVSGVPAG